MAFKGVTVSFSGMDKAIKECEGKRVEMMGGKVTPEFSPNVDILIAKNCKSGPKYRVSIQPTLKESILFRLLVRGRSQSAR
jgi:hypothetical protein